MPEEKETPRLYSRQHRLPVDVVAPQHQVIHADLERWGSWLRPDYEPATCASIEKLYTKGGDTTPAATAPMPANPRFVAIDQAVRLMHRRVPKHATCIKHFYVEREDPKLICRRLAIHGPAFARFMWHCRAMVLNILRELDI